MGTVSPRTVALKGGRSVLIRPAREEDAAALLEHGRRIVGTSPHAVTQVDELPEGEQKEREVIKEHLESPVKLMIVAEIDAMPPLVGMLTFHGHSKRRMAHHGHFGIGVDEPWRGKGVGRALIQTLLDWARDHAVIEKVCLGVFADNLGAQALYKSMGFVEECRRSKEFKVTPGKYVDDVQMSLWVKTPGS